MVFQACCYCNALSYPDPECFIKKLPSNHEIDDDKRTKCTFDDKHLIIQSRNPIKQDLTLPIKCLKENFISLRPVAPAMAPQACWEKFFKYMDVEPILVKPSYKTMSVTGMGMGVWMGLGGWGWDSG